MKVVVGAELVTEVSDAIVRHVAKLGHDVVVRASVGSSGPVLGERIGGSLTHRLEPFATVGGR